MDEGLLNVDMRLLMGEGDRQGRMDKVCDKGGNWEPAEAGTTNKGRPNRQLLTFGRRRSISARSWAGLKGFVRNEAAPAFWASRELAACALMVITMTGMA